MAERLRRHGRTGRLVVGKALEAGHKVRALARRPAALEHLRHERLEVVEGDVLKPASRRAHARGSDAAVSAL